jgi:hypothetical protein
MECPNIEVCPYINSSDGEEITKYKNEFCNGDYSKCARFSVGNILGSVPDDLRPDDYEEEQKIINNK